MADDKPATGQDNDQAQLSRIARDMQALRSMLTEVVNYMKDAESEVPEKMRRFIMYYHDVRDIVSLHRELGQEPPAYLLREIERCDDRYRHILDDMNAPGAAFEKVRQEMTQRPGNRWDHGRLLPREGQ